MPAGIQIFNDYGSILIDDTNPSMALRQRTVLTSNNQTLPQLSVANSDHPSIAIRSFNFACWLSWSSWTGTTRNWTLRLAEGATGSQNVTAYVFDRPTNSGANSGLQVFDALGRLTFDALGKYGRVSGVQNGNGTFVGTAGREYAATILSTRHRDVIEVHPSIPGNRRRTIYQTGVRNSGNNIIVEDAIVTQLDYPSSETPREIAYGTARALILDVTGY